MVFCEADQVVISLMKLFRLSLSEGSTICFVNAFFSALTCQSLEKQKKNPQEYGKKKPSLSLPTPSTWHPGLQNTASGCAARPELYRDFH